MPRKKNNKIPPLLLVLICACLLFAMYVSVSTIALGLWGSTVMGTVNSYDSRLDDTDAGVNRSRTVSKGYSFTVNGKEYRGYVIYVSDEAWPRLSQGETRSERISYFPSFPYINKPSALTDFDQMGIAGLLYHLLSPLACLFLLLLVSGTIKGKKKTKKAGPGSQANGKRSSKATHCLSQGGAFSSGCGVKIPAGIPDVCMACGADLPDDVEFCTSCGTAVNAGAITIPSQTASPPSWQSIDGNNASLVGFSQRYNLPEILAAAQKNKKTSLGCMAVLVFVPLIGFPLAGLLIDEFPLGEALVIGVGVALAMLVINLFALGRTKRPIWEGTVVNKYSKERSEHRGGDGDNYRTYTEFTTVINTDAGKKKTIVEKNSGRYMYDYLAVGDRVRFHPMFGTYEKYDKSKDRIIYCNVCSMMNPIQNDRCKRCTNLLFK